jgi:predicted membrane GTPase involved in stress response
MIPNPSSSSKSGNAAMLEPVEECTIIVKEEFAGTVVQKLNIRKGVMISYDSGSHGEEEGWVKIVMEVPSRGLIGYLAGEFKNDVHGQGTLNHIFKGYEPYKGEVDTGRRGSLISMTDGMSSAYAMAPLQARGTMFIPPNTQCSSFILHLANHAHISSENSVPRHGNR